MFQFLIGAIGSPLNLNVHFPCSKFQFLIGAIGRITELHFYLIGMCFNSLLVRLEAVTKCASYIQRKRFYPQKTNHFLVYLQYYVFPRFSTTPHYQYVMSISLFFKPKCQRTFSVFSLSDDLPIK